MGYDLHITRRTDWVDDGPDISLEEWQAYSGSSPDMQVDGCAEATTENGEKVRLEGSSLAVWTGYSRHVPNGPQAWFFYESGQIYVKNPDVEIRRRMFLIALHLGAQVQGDDGEQYNQDGDVIDQGRVRVLPRPGPWWRFWRW